MRGAGEKIVGVHGRFGKGVSAIVPRVIRVTLDPRAGNASGRGAADAVERGPEITQGARAAVWAKQM